MGGGPADTMKADTAALLSAAARETDERRLGLSAWFLELHNVRRENGRPVAALVEPGPGSIWNVTFQLENARPSGARLRRLARRGAWRHDEELATEMCLYG